MTTPWAIDESPPAPYATDGVTLVEGATFCISTPTGNLVPGAPMGLFLRDTRVLSEWILEVDGDRLDPLTVVSPEPYEATFLSRAHPRPGQLESTLLVVRRREISEGMRESVELRNLSGEAAAIVLTMRVGADFADLFAVKRGASTSLSSVHADVDDRSLRLRPERGPAKLEVRIVPSVPAGSARMRVAHAAIAWTVVVPARGEWQTEIVVEAHVPGSRTPAHGTVAAPRRKPWRGSSARFTSPDPDLVRTLDRSLDDLDALRIADPAHPDRDVIAAGAPWFMALFGRDSLLTSWMALPLDVGLGLGTVRALADEQGSVEDPVTEEQPGRILHERRYGAASADDPFVYYGSADATPLFVMLVGELRRWGVPLDDLVELLPAVDRALTWIVEYGDRDGDGFVEYRRATDRGLRNQGWKDSADGVNYADGRLAEPPIALCEVQGYVYAAYLARAHFARELGDSSTAATWVGRATALREQFNERFWLPDKGWYAVGLDGHGQPIDALASNMAHCLWTGIVAHDRARAVADLLLSEEMFSGWGVRTLSTRMGAYNPMAYHNGSVWPHDNAIAVAGLARYGFTTHAARVAGAVLDAAAAFGGRLPELFCGFPRDEFPHPVPYPTSCSPQAWAAAAPLLLLRSLLRLDPQAPAGEVRVSPFLPGRYLPLTLAHVTLAERPVDVVVAPDNEARINGMGHGITVVTEPRAAMTALAP